MKLEKIKFSNLVNDTLSGHELSQIVGGSECDTVGCDSNVCSVKLVTTYCTDGDGICKSGIGPDPATTAA